MFGKLLPTNAFVLTGLANFQAVSYSEVTVVNRGKAFVHQLCTKICLQKLTADYRFKCERSQLISNLSADGQ